MSVGIFALKVGLVTGVTGVSIATPILLKNKVSSVTENSQSLQVTTDSQLGGSGRSDLGRTGSLPPEEHLERAGSPVVSSDLSHSGSSMSSPAPVIKKEEFDKKCFVVPASAQGENENIQLLTCYDPQKFISKEFKEEQPEYDSIFHIYEQSKEANPIEIGGNLIWNTNEQNLSARLTKDSVTSPEYVFAVIGEHWGGISPNKAQIDLTGKNECAIFEATLKDSHINSTHLLVCGGDSDAHDSDNPKGIPLTDWTKRS